MPKISSLAKKIEAAKASQPVVLKSGKSLTPTPEQALILEAVQQGHIVLVVEAGAGTGKTSVLKMIGETLPGNGQYTAFNSSLVAESKEKFEGTRVACNTTHSLAFRAEGKRFAHRLNKGRVFSSQIAAMLGLTEDFTYVGKDDKKKSLGTSFLATQVMGAIKRFCQSADREITKDHFRYLDGIDLPDEDGRRTYENNEALCDMLLPYARKAWADLSSPEGTLPFNHDCYVKIWQLNHPIIAGDYLLLDEHQDTAEVMLDVVRQQTIPVVLVGDSAQQIYQWRGAVNAADAFPDAPRLFLSQSFRFGEAIAQVANSILELLQEPTKLRLKGLASIPSRICEIESPTAVLCRTNAVAVSTLLGAIALGQKPFLVGGGADVISFVEAARDLQQGKGTSHPDLACFDSWQAVQVYAKEDDGEDLRLMVKLIDEFGALRILEALKNMPQEKDADLVISTAHKSKGREWDKVRLAQDFPTKSKSSDADLKLLYVAATRAKLELDVSCCPFFTGNDSIDVSKVIASTPKPEAANVPQDGIVPPAPATKPAATTFTWQSFGGNWVVRGPSGKLGERVDVVRKNGSVSRETLKSIVREFTEATLYSVR